MKKLIVLMLLSSVMAHSEASEPSYDQLRSLRHMMLRTHPHKDLWVGVGEKFRKQVEEDVGNLRNRDIKGLNEGRAILDKNGMPILTGRPYTDRYGRVLTDAYGQPLRIDEELYTGLSSARYNAFNEVSRLMSESLKYADDSPGYLALQKRLNDTRIKSERAKIEKQMADYRNYELMLLDQARAYQQTIDIHQLRRWYGDNAELAAVREIKNPAPLPKVFTGSLTALPPGTTVSLPPMPQKHPIPASLVEPDAPSQH